MTILPDSPLLIALDIALNQSGVAILTTSGVILHTEVVTVVSSRKYYDKLSFLYERYNKMFSDIVAQTNHPVGLLLEGRLKAGFSGNTLASIEGARVTSYLAFKSSMGDHENYVRTYDPQTIKMHYCGKRNANKKDMRASLISLYPHLSALNYQEDVFDALAIAYYHTAKEPNVNT